VSRGGNVAALRAGDDRGRLAGLQGEGDDTTVGQVRLLQRFWVPDAPVPMIETSGLQTATARFVAAVLPYAADATLLAIGAVLLSRQRIRSFYRAYAEHATRTRPALSEQLLDRLLLFTPK
jgi:hypothetical protein